MNKTEKDAHFMEMAISLAERGMRRGDGGPFGAVVVNRDGEVIGEGWNRVLVTNDPTAHAEVVAIRDACSRLNTYWLEDCDLYANCEPCPMCLSAIYWAKISHLYYAATRKDAAAIGFNDNLIYNEINLPVGQRILKSSQVEREKSVKVMQQWMILENKRPY